LLPRVSVGGEEYEVARLVTIPSASAVALALLAGLVLSGCREEEQNRVVFFEPGVYLGAQDQPLDAETVEALVQRTGNPVF
jgi:hypothetical protein